MNQPSSHSADGHAEKRDEFSEKEKEIEAIIHKRAGNYPFRDDQETDKKIWAVVKKMKGALPADGKHGHGDGHDAQHGHGDHGHGHHEHHGHHAHGGHGHAHTHVEEDRLAPLRRQGISETSGWGYMTRQFIAQSMHKGHGHGAHEEDPHHKATTNPHEKTEKEHEKNEKKETAKPEKAAKEEKQKGETKPEAGKK